MKFTGSAIGYTWQTYWRMMKDSTVKMVDWGSDWISETEYRKGMWTTSPEPLKTIWLFEKILKMI